tara:strand:+ start:210 stop:740 length:531 start_codon:yes stop_codon:yes gene_type:complete
MNKALFLDRDGVINIDKKYIYKSKDLIFTDGIKELIKSAKLKSYKIICITNQSGIARGFYKEKDLKLFMNHLNQSLLNSIGYELDRYYFCPHHPDGIIKEYSYICNCRKPATGLFKKACYEFNIDCTQSIFIGDKLCDLQAAESMNIKNIYFYSTSNLIYKNQRYISINNIEKVKL